MFQRMNMVEKVGSGINRTRNEMQAADLPESELGVLQREGSRKSGTWKIILKRDIG